MIKLRDLLFEDIESHLRDRGIDPTRMGVILDKKANIATFLLYNLSGQLVGYQQYNPAGSKKEHSKELSKYYNYISKTGTISKLAVYGVETISDRFPFIFLVEGVFDAAKIHNAGFPAIAVLSNNPKILRSWLFALRKKVYVVADNDAAGRALAKFGDRAFTVPAPHKDLGDMSQEEATKFLKSIVK